MTSPPDTLAEKACAALLKRPGPRHLVAIAGPPGAGKSTVTELIAAKLRDEGFSAAVVPMDGFHLDNRILQERGLSARKGAPETFDVAGFKSLVHRIARADTDVVYPVFDRHRDIAIAGAEALDPETEYILFEGNYLLLDRAPWKALMTYWTSTIWVSAPMDILQKRLMDRWRAEGLSDTVARQKVDQNDMPNVRFVCDHSRPADIDLSKSWQEPRDQVNKGDHGTSIQL